MTAAHLDHNLCPTGIVVLLSMLVEQNHSFFIVVVREFELVPLVVQLSKLHVDREMEL